MKKVSFGDSERDLQPVGPSTIDNTQLVYNKIRGTSLELDQLHHGFVVDPVLEDAFEGIIGVEVPDEYWSRLINAGITKSLQTGVSSVSL